MYAQLTKPQLIDRIRQRGGAANMSLTKNALIARLEGLEATAPAPLVQPVPVQPVPVQPVPVQPVPVQPVPVQPVPVQRGRPRRPLLLTTIQPALVQGQAPPGYTINETDIIYQPTPQPTFGRASFGQARLVVPATIPIVINGYHTAPLHADFDGDVMTPPVLPKEELKECAICGENQLPPAQWLNCGHAVCSACLNLLEKAECPLDRGPLAGPLVTPQVMQGIRQRETVNQRRAALKAQRVAEWAREHPDDEAGVARLYDLEIPEQIITTETLEFIQNLQAAGISKGDIRAQVRAGLLAQNPLLRLEEVNTALDEVLA